MKTTAKVIYSLLLLGLIWACTEETDQMFEERIDQEQAKNSKLGSGPPIMSLPQSLNVSVEPYIIDGANNGGNRTCDEAGIAFNIEGFEYTSGKNDYPFNEDVAWPEGLTVDVDKSGTYVSWSFVPPNGYCLLNMAVIVKGGNNANVYFYESGVNGDSGLASPKNPSGKPAGLSNLTFCFNLEKCCNAWIVYGSNLNGGSDPLDDAIYAYDLNAQTQTLVYDPTPIDESENYPNALAFDPINKRIYFGTDDGRFYYHEIGSGTHVQVEGDDLSGSFGAMAGGSWYNGKFYYVENGTNKLYEVSIVADVASRTQIGTVPTSNGYGDLAFDPANPGVFVASAGDPVSVWYWYNVNNNTSGVLSRSGGTAKHLQLAYSPNGTLYAVEGISGQFYTVSYDLNAETVTLTLDWDSPYTFTDLASGPQCQ